MYHWVLSWRPGEHTTDAEKLDVAKDFMQRVGFVDTQYLISAHYDKAHEHLHIVANIVNNRGERIPTMGLIEKAHEAAAAITRERGYQWGETAKKSESPLTMIKLEAFAPMFKIITLSSRPQYFQAL